MEKKLIELFKKLSKENDRFIREKMKINPFCFAVYANNKIGIISLEFNNSQAKERIKNMLKGFLVKQEIKAYILLFDAKLTVMDNNKKKAIVKDAVIRGLYTPSEVLRQYVIYKDGIIEKKEEEKDNRKSIKVQDEWDLWGVQIDEDEVLKDYWDFKEKNKDLYKGTE